MELSIERRSFLAGEHRSLGWIAIPDSAPDRVKNRIVEWRNQNYAKPSVAPRKAVQAVQAVVASEAKREQMRRRLALASL